MHGFPRRVIIDVGEEVGVSAGPGLFLLLARALVLLTEGAFQLGPHSCRHAAPVAPPRVRHRRRATVNILRSRRPQVVPLTLELLLGPVRRQPARGEKDLELKSSVVFLKGQILLFRCRIPWLTGPVVNEALHCPDVRRVAVAEPLRDDPVRALASIIGSRRTSSVRSGLKRGCRRCPHQFAGAPKDVLRKVFRHARQTNSDGFGLAHAVAATGVGGESSRGGLPRNTTKVNTGETTTPTTTRTRWPAA